MDVSKISAISGSEKVDTFHVLNATAAVQARQLQEEKGLQIDIACNDCDLSQLAKLAVLPGGFIRDELRKRTCRLPILQVAS